MGPEDESRVSLKNASVKQVKFGRNKDELCTRPEIEVLSSREIIDAGIFVVYHHQPDRQGRLTVGGTQLGAGLRPRSTVDITILRMHNITGVGGSASTSATDVCHRQLDYVI